MAPDLLPQIAGFLCFTNSSTASRHGALFFYPRSPMQPDIEAIHEAVHAEYKQRLAEAEFDAAVQRAHVADRERIIAELTALLNEATKPPGHDA